jgi:hypothetical protein
MIEVPSARRGRSMAFFTHSLYLSVSFFLLVKSIFQTLREINGTGGTIVLVEQNTRAALKLAHRSYVM